MDKTTILIYSLIVGVAVLSSVIKRIRKANNPPQNNKKPLSTQQKTTYNKPQNTQPKSLEDILQTLLNEKKPENKPVQQTQKPLVVADNQPTKFTTLENTSTLENIDEDHYAGEDKYYGQDTELSFEKEANEFEIVKDHRVHGKGFDDVVEEGGEDASEWANIDWRKAVITAEILRRPQY